MANLQARRTMNNKKAFTLIELLVVVLIIGILSAVAIPKYQMAVNKSHFAKLKILAKSMAKASQEYFIANNAWPKKFDELSLSLPDGMNITEINYVTCGQNNKFFCCITPAGYNPAIVCGQNDYSFAFHTMINSHDYCIANQNDKQATQLCQSLGTQANGWEFWTPEGSKDGYMYYEL